MITFVDLTQHIQADYVEKAKSKEILRAVGSVIDDINAKMPLRDKIYEISEETVTGALSSSASNTITGANNQFADLVAGDHFEISNSTDSGGDDMDGNYTILTKTSDNVVIVEETIASGLSSAAATIVSYMHNDDIHITYDYSLNTLEVVDTFIEIDDILVDDDEWDSVTDYVFENSDSTYDYLRFIDRRTMEFITDVTGYTISIRIVKEYDRPDDTSDDIDLPNEFFRLLVLGVASYLMGLPKYSAIYKDVAGNVSAKYVSEFESRAKREYDRYPDRSIELEYKY